MTPRTHTSPRKSAVQARSKATVDTILEAAARILVKEGYDRASTNRIAEAAGVSIGSLYQYFPSKEAIVAEILERHSEEMFSVVTTEMARLHDAPLRVVVRELVRLMIEAHSVDPKLHKVLVEQVPRVGRMQRFVDIEERTRALTRGYLELRARDIRPENLDLAAFVVATAVEALTHAAVLFRPDLLAHRETVDEITELVVRYLEH